MEITEAAGQVLERAYQAAERFNPNAKVRIHRLGDRIETSFVEEAESGDQVVEHEGLTIFVENGIEGTLDVSAEHDHLVVL